MSSNNNLVTCKCGWVSFGVSLEDACKEINEFNNYFFSLPLDKRQELYNNNPSSLDYYKCQLCNGTEFRPYDADIDSDVTGCTINPVVYKRCCLQ